VSRRLDAARSRAELRVQTYIDAAFALSDEKGTTEFTIQEVIERSGQSLRGFYQYFDGKDELLLALLEESIIEAADDLRRVVEGEHDPLTRLRSTLLRLHEWCDPADVPRVASLHYRRPISEFAVQLALTHPARVGAAMAPIAAIIVGLLDDARAAGAITVADTRHTAVLLQQTVMHSWLTNRLAEPGNWITADETWEFCLHGLTP
jgi:AcrR family transcriptional regulator